jgi:hypothetical protein
MVKYILSGETRQSMSKARLVIFMILVLSSVTLSLFVFNNLDWIQNVQAQQQQTTPGITGNTSGTVETATATGSSNNMTGAKFLIIQGAQSGLLSEVNATTSTVELRNVSDKTILFSERPDRIVSSVNTTDFIDNWSSGQDSFAADPPNAVLVLDDIEQSQELAIIELYNPEYDSEANTLKYIITAENATAATTSLIGLPSEFGQSTLVIDIPIGINLGDDA